MIYDTLNQSPTGLRTTGLVFGSLLVAAHAAGLWKGEAARKWLKAFPFNVTAGRVLLGIAALWTWGMFSGQLAFLGIPRMDMGEFFHLRGKIQLLVPVAAVLVGIYCTEFLSVRALGCVLLLLAAVLLDAAFQHEPVTRLLLVIWAYAAVLKALFWIGMPYLLRDQIDWATADARRWSRMMIAGLAYSGLIFAFAWTW